jgi:hypothetical protein
MCTSPKPITLLCLPPEIIVHIGQFLGWKSLFALEATCRYMRTVRAVLPSFMTRYNKVIQHNDQALWKERFVSLKRKNTNASVELVYFESVPQHISFKAQFLLEYFEHKLDQRILRLTEEIFSCQQLMQFYKIQIIRPKITPHVIFPPSSDDDELPVCSLTKINTISFQLMSMCCFLCS